MISDPPGLEPDFGPPLERVRGFDGHPPREHANPLPDVLEPRPFEGPAELAEALRALLRHSEQAGVRRLCWCDPDFAAWPLGEADWIDALTRWAHAGPRELVMVAASYEALGRDHPRFVGWRRDHAHVLTCLVPDASRTLELPCLWVDTSGQGLKVFDAAQLRGRIGFDRTALQAVQEDFDAIAQRGTPGFAAVTLGL